MSITSPSLLTLVVIGAVIVPLALVLVRQRTKATWQRAVGSWVAVVVAQVLAVASLGLYVNRQYGFYSSWDDALGKTDNGAAAIAAAAERLWMIRMVIAAGVHHQRLALYFADFFQPRCQHRVVCHAVGGHIDGRQIAQVPVGVRPEVFPGLLRVKMPTGRQRRHRRVDHSHRRRVAAAQAAERIQHLPLRRAPRAVGSCRRPAGLRSRPSP